VSQLDEWDAFDEMAACFRGGDWYAAWMEARQAVAHFAQGEGFSPAGIGWVAWRELNDEQRGLALNQLFTDYYIAVVAEEREERLAQDAANGKTYLEGWEPSSLHDAVISAGLTEDDAEVTVDARALHGVLSELELLQHRLAMRDREREPD